jgi:hypothetical protein
VDTNGSCVAGSSRACKPATSSAVDTGLIIFGPLPGTIVKSMPIAGSGVMISVRSKKKQPKDKVICVQNQIGDGGAQKT